MAFAGRLDMAGPQIPGRGPSSPRRKARQQSSYEVLAIYVENGVIRRVHFVRAQEERTR